MIIDFRMRPPARGFLNIGVYDDVARTAKLTECFSMKQAPSVAQKSPELMLQEMDTAGVTMGVIPGRNGHFKGSISNDDIMYADDPRIYPIYDLCEQHRIPVILMLGGRAGPDITYSDPKIINRIAADFPKTNFIISHGGWPWVQQILGVCFFQKNIYLCPDMYLFNCSGAADYIMAANNFMQDRFLFGTAYPLMPIVDCVSHFKGLFKPEVLPKLLYKNAAKLLNIELPEEA